MIGINKKSAVYGRVLMSLLVLVSLSAIAKTADDKNYSRIISTDAGVTDVLIALGMAEKLVGVDITSVVPAGLKVAKLGYHRTLSTEGLLSLNPDLIIASAHMGPPETVALLKTNPIKLLQLPVASNEKMLIDNIQRIGEITKKEKTAEHLLQHIERAMLTLNKNLLTAQSKVAFLLYMDGRGLRLAGNDTTGSDIIAMLGGNNLGKHNSYRSISAEALLSLEPDVIIVAGQGGGESPVAALLKENPLLLHTSAGKQQKIIAIDSSFLVAGISIKALDAVAALSGQLQQVSVP